MYAAVIQEGLKIGSADSPVAQATKLGWVLTGPTSVDESLKPKGLVHGLHTSVEPTLSEVLSKFWQIEEVPSIPLLSPEDQRCEDHYSKTVSRNEQGRFRVLRPSQTPVTLRWRVYFAQRDARQKTHS